MTTPDRCRRKVRVYCPAPHKGHRLRQGPDYLGRCAERTCKSLAYRSCTSILRTRTKRRPSTPVSRAPHNIIRTRSSSLLERFILLDGLNLGLLCLAFARTCFSVVGHDIGMYAARLLSCEAVSIFCTPLNTSALFSLSLPAIPSPPKSSSPVTLTFVWIRSAVSASSPPLKEVPCSATIVTYWKPCQAKMGASGCEMFARSVCNTV